MTGKSDETRQIEIQLKRALSHPKRTEIFGYILTQESKTGTGEAELIEMFGLSPARLKYHLTVLRGADLIAPAAGGSEQGQGERAYVATRVVVL
jgi:DNA-binding transcriptional ArsR family regulator